MTSHDAPPGPGLRRPRMVGPALPARPENPATRHGFRDATADLRQITAWFGRHPDWNLAIATGAPGPDVLDVDQHGEAGNGYAAFRQLRDAGLLDGATAYVRTPSGGLHAYFTGTGQRNGHLPGCHLDFRSRGGYVLTPPSRIDGKPYQLVKALHGRGAAGLGRRHPAPAPPARAAAPAPPARPPGPQRPGPLGRQPRRRQPQRRLVLGRQPRARSRPGRRPQPPGRRRPPGRPGRTGNHPNPRFRTENRPNPHARTRPPGRGR